jgi:glycogen operon protein
VTSPREKVLGAITSEFEFDRGQPAPLGVTVARGGVNFAIFSEHATSVSLALFLPGEDEPLMEFVFDPRFNRTGNVWHAFLKGLDPGIEYAYRMDRGPDASVPGLHRFDSGTLLLDPYARAVVRSSDSRTDEHGLVRTSRRGTIVDARFDWEFDQPLNHPLEDTIIYELHVRGFTQHPNSGVRYPGTFTGLVEKIPYLRELGVTSVELMPVNEFDENDNPRVDPTTGKKLANFWGYHPLSFFALHGPYCSRTAPSDQLREFKEMVKEFHLAGIEVILDVVFNHTGEGDGRGPTVSLRGIDNSVYYMLEHGKYRNYSGCGNTLNCNHPVVKDLILDSLRYWVMELHVDGFRFDLASILGRGRDGSVLANPPLLERIAADPVLASTKLIAEAWDAAGLYQVGSFPAMDRWAEWNGKFRDDVRRYLRGEPGMVPELAKRLTGSPDLYRDAGRPPCHSINFVTCHDGFTLEDVVSYNEKHNSRNGENNADGAHANYSWNCGAEGVTSNSAVNALRLRQKKNFLTLLYVAQGVPMVLYGDELGRTQHGNNNAYCHDNDLAWMDWSSVDAGADGHDPFFRFARLLIALRRAHPILRSRDFPNEPSASSARAEWHGVRLGEPDWGWESHSLALHLRDNRHPLESDHVFVISNAFWESLPFELPQIPGLRWYRSVDTSLASPEDICEPGSEVPLQNRHWYEAAPRSTAVLIARQ